MQSMKYLLIRSRFPTLDMRPSTSDPRPSTSNPRPLNLDPRQLPKLALNKSQFQGIAKAFPELNIDLFASRLDIQLPVYCSWKPDPGCAYVDAFTINWNSLNFFAFPPFSMISKYIQKINQVKAKGILIICLTNTAVVSTGSPTTIQTTMDHRPITTAVDPYSRQRLPHPLQKSLRLMVCPLSGTPLHNKTLQQTLPTSSWHHGDEFG